MADRIEMLVGTIDIAAAKGLELGPLAKPVVARGRGDIRYLDHVDTDALRRRYASHVDFDIEAIVDIDYAIGDGTIGEAVGADAPFDYIVASHVIEHVPDLIGWLDELRGILRDDGVLSLAVPDHRRCFDTLRSPTVVADLVHAHLTGATAPTPRQVFDHYSSAVSWRLGSIEWPFEPPFDELVPVHSEQDAMQRATSAGATGEYDDVHCWVFTPRSFQRVIAGLQRLGLVAFRLESCSESVEGEFFARLIATTAAEATGSAVAQGPVEDLRAAEAATVRAELNEARRQLAEATAELTAMEQSRSWRITAPLRAFNARRARRSG